MTTDSIQKHAERCDEVIAGYGQGDMQANLIDLLADAMHWSDDCLLDFHILLMKAGRRYLKELQNPNQPRRNKS